MTWHEITPRERAARLLLGEIEAHGVVVWVNWTANRWECRDPFGAFSNTLRERFDDLAVELQRVVTTCGCRDGYIRGATRWHVAVIRDAEPVTLCGNRRLTTGKHVQCLPSYGPGGGLCKWCLQCLVNRELACLPRGTSSPHPAADDGRGGIP